MSNDVYRCPRGEEGRRIIMGMDDEHGLLTDWGLSFLKNEPCKILDIGCGGGMLLSKVSGMFPGCRMAGIDISPDCTTITIGRCSELIGSGRLVVAQASVSDIPFADGSFDLVTAVETYFFWPDLGSDMAEAVSKLRPGGTLLVVSEQYPHPDFKEINDRHCKEYGMNLLENGEMASLLESLGLEVEVHTVEEKNWVAFVGVKA